MRILFTIILPALWGIYVGQLGLPLVSTLLLCAGGGMLLGTVGALIDSGTKKEDT